MDQRRVHKGRKMLMKKISRTFIASLGCCSVLAFFGQGSEIPTPESLAPSTDFPRRERCSPHVHRSPPPLSRSRVYPKVIVCPQFVQNFKREQPSSSNLYTC